MEADQSATAVRAGRADLNLARARLNRLEELSRFKRVTAPFAGRITRRQAEAGVLVGPSTPLFQLAAVDRLRVQVQVPQSYMRSVVPGLPARLTVREFPNETFEGKVTRTSGSLDNARTMTAEIELLNPDRRLMSGAYAAVGLTAPNTSGAVLIPANALIVNQNGTQVALVQAASVLKLLTVRTGRDLGSHIEVLEGVSAGAQVVTNPADTLRDGIPVQVRAPSAGKTRVSATVPRAVPR
jgi:RND family efflux transporter MFP subunit